jgi:hypothetical protein
MDETSGPVAEPRGLRLLRAMVMVLTGTMIVGLVTIVALVVIRFPKSAPPLPLPDRLVLPDGTRADAFTMGPDWYAVVSGDTILIYDRASLALRQRIVIDRP